MKTTFLLLLLLSLFTEVSEAQQSVQNNPDSLSQPFATKSVRDFSKVIGWEDGAAPTAPPGFTVTKYANGFDNPRSTCVTPLGDVLVVESNTNYSLPKKVGATLIGAGRSDNLSKSADRIMLLRDKNRDGIPEQRDTFLNNLNQPFGMLFLGNWFYVANTDALWRYPYSKDSMRITGKGKKIIDLPSGKYNQHWTRNLLANPKGTKIYIAVGSSSNIGEHGLEYEMLRAAILEINPDGTGLRTYASGLRNPVGMDWNPETNMLWTVVNERDGLGDDLVPDYLTGVKEGGFYGWPYIYMGKYADPRVKDHKPELAARALAPDVPLIAHTATLGLVFYTAKAFPQQYKNGAFLAQHGSYNRSVLSGYKVLFQPFKKGKPKGAPEDFLTGFIADLDKREVRGRPVGLTLLPDGSLLLTDDVSNVIWRITYNHP
ncbi:PQQ-dependent sugar dehydrogenase [Taibaiella koreensis]|uniref:PQQ-dependent sugar dehydrogenase n=1 Tax=Taibaiella koreensis TaxID=1268548 RepID=UPI000E59D179|nr:sorbosone dehydrogenase family protein [Taibaiella koreensis]